MLTLKQAATAAGFPSAHALRMYVKRHPNVAEVRYRTHGCRTRMMLFESDVVLLRDTLSS